MEINTEVQNEKKFTRVSQPPFMLFKYENSPAPYTLQKKSNNRCHQIYMTEEEIPVLAAVLYKLKVFRKAFTKIKKKSTKEVKL